MNFSSFSTFCEDSKHYRTIPIVKKYIVDTFTPIQLFQLFKEEAVYLLESKDSESSWSRYSFIGLNPFLFIEENHGEFSILNEQRKTISKSNSITTTFKQLQDHLAIKLPDLEIPFVGGAVGYIGYDTVSIIEKVKKHETNDLNQQNCMFFVCETVIAFDHQEKQLYFIHYERVNGTEDESRLKATYQLAEAKLNKFESMLKQKPQSEHLPLAVSDSFDVNFDEIQSNYEKGKFLEDVEKVKEYIRAGDIFQGVLSQRFEIPISTDGFSLYRILRIVNPSPYLFYIRINDTELVGSSPERLIYIQNKHLEIHPIAGTRRRGKTVEEDLFFEEELKNDEKERAEHYMLVDLARNDLGRVADYGTVNTPTLMEVGRFSHVMHLISKVTAQLKEEVHPMDALLSSFPAGTVSGAPKIRAMQIIQELEPTARGSYAGCVAYVGFDGNVDSCITIRTITVKNNVAYVQAGAGIVVDSVPELEWKETCNKASAMLKAIQLAEKVFSEEEKRDERTSSNVY
ncbi:MULTISPECIES: anthranilate synthase component I [Bacillaceae]|uniref:anthranilate synthase component I n=1 Tax=Bacillaceae TaxID=186817 RepID=UPI000BFE7478|nr:MULTISPECIES: anthranilate synthase component I [Bacillaceae]PGT87456.1 anthranilate synthase component I [Bacillus sp. AFS040349]UGB29262.1 anthranilate synthase component I [Metabacillus sp. B2-18]